MVKETVNATIEETPDEGFLMDFAGVPDEAGFEVLPRGFYPAIVDELTFGVSQRSGNPMWTWIFEVSEGDFAGRKLFFYSVFAESSLPRLKKILGAIAPELLTQKFDPAAIASEGYMVGKSVKIRVDTRPYEGQMRNNVRDVLGGDGESGGGFLA